MLDTARLRFLLVPGLPLVNDIKDVIKRYVIEVFVMNFKSLLDNFTGEYMQLCDDNAIGDEHTTCINTYAYSDCTSSIAKSLKDLKLISHLLSKYTTYWGSTTWQICRDSEGTLGHTHCINLGIKYTDVGISITSS